MIAACPKCQTRYRVDTDRLGPDGARLRCSQCSTVFRVRLPEATPASVSTVTTVEMLPARSEAPSAERSEAPASGGSAPRAASQGRAELVETARASLGNQPRSAEDRSVTASAESRPNLDAPQFDHRRLVLVAHPDPDACKHLAEALEDEGLQVLVAHDGVEAILTIQRALPRAIVLDAALPKMFGFQVCEIVKRNESLRGIHVCLMGAIHKEERYRRAPNEFYGADFYTEPPALPGSLFDWLARVGVPLRNRAGLAAEPAASRPEVPRADLGDEAPRSKITTEVPRSQATSGDGIRASGALGAARSEAQSAAPSEAHEARTALGKRPERAEGRSVTAGTDSLGSPTRRVEPSPPQQPTQLAIGRVAAPADPLSAERAQAERLARIIVSDIVLYNEEKFAAAVRSGTARDALRDELEEGRSLFRERIDARIREERDFLADELERVARARGMA